MLTNRSLDALAQWADHTEVGLPDGVIMLKDCDHMYCNKPPAALFEAIAAKLV